ncbi:hypothetical protein BJ741DRAFT_617584 [Chytriomyces cf. hyalinus JEL632]|nr:hypothetical protein BJ741DRAFT_617584 [Chytriomyces cf. hyalinus JEL632]
MDIPPPGDKYNLNRVAVFLTTVSIAAIILCMLLHLMYIMLVDRPVQRVVLTSANIHLVLMATSLVGLHISLNLTIEAEYLSARYRYSAAGQTACAALMEVLAIRYSWDRSASIVRRLLPKTAKFLHILALWIPLMGVLETIPSLSHAILHGTDLDAQFSSILFVASTVLPLVFAILAVVFDGVLLTAFCIYTRGILEDLEGEGERFYGMIAWCGIASIVFFAMSITLYGVGLVFRKTNFFIFLACSYSVLVVSYVALLLMKLGNAFVPQTIDSLLGFKTTNVKMAATFEAASKKPVPVAS